MLLLTGGIGSRLGGPKHDLPHPSGGTWGSHLVSVFRNIFPDGPVHLLGDPLTGLTGLPAFPDPRQGPAVALQHWASLPAPQVDAWWVVACDQVRWRAPELRAWLALAEAADPGRGHWVIGKSGGQLQPLGGVLPHALRAALATATSRSLLALVAALPHCILENHLPGWADVDTVEDLAAFEAETE